MITLGQVFTPVSSEDALETLLEFLEGLGFQATSWQPGSIQRTLIHGFADLYSGLTIVVSDLARAPFPQHARGEYQDLLGEHVFDLERLPATATAGTFRVTLSAAAAPAAWADGELVFADAEQDPANTFRNVGADSINPGQTISISVVAETPGAAANIANNTALYLWTPITGLSAANPAPTGQSTWITAQGQDEESSERYAERMTLRWARLSAGTEGAYRGYALEALPELTRVIATQGAAEGTVRVIGATAVGGLTAPQIQGIADFLNGVTDGVSRRPINDVLTVESATVRTTPAIAATLTVDSTAAATAAANAEDALVSLFGSIPIGGEKIAPDPAGYVRQARMYGAIMALDGVRNVTGLPADILLGATEIYAPAITIAVVET